MNKKMALVMALGIIALLSGAIWLSSGQNHGQAPERQFPWTIESTASGDTTVFGMTLGRSTLADAERQFRSRCEVTLFMAGDETAAIEGYFHQVNPAGLDARVVVVIAVPPAEAMAMYRHGARVSRLPDGTNKVSLRSTDLTRVRQYPIASLTYVPKLRLVAADIERRLGTPSVRIRESGGDVIHWLYANMGLDVALNDNGQAVFQYVAPRDFSRLRAPLIKQGEVIE